jgi:hypothetical protein
MAFETSLTHLPPLATTSATASVLVNSLNCPLKQKVLFLNLPTVAAEAALDEAVVVLVEIPF